MSKKKRRNIAKHAKAADETSAPHPHRWILPALIALVLVSYWNSLHGALVFDDSRLIHFNFHLRDWSNWREIFLSERYRPLLVWTFALNYKMTGMNTVSYHWFNILFHATAVTLFYLFLLRQTSSWRISALAAAIMAVHPLNTESVSYISSRSTVLCSVFYFSALLFLDSYIRGTASGANAFLPAIGYFFCFFLGATVKEEAAMIPVAALLYQYIFFGWQEIRKHIGFNLVSTALLVAGGVFRVAMQIKHGGVPPHPLSIWIPTEICIWIRYIGLAFWPAPLNIDPDIHPVKFINPLWWISFAIIGAIVIYAWRAKKKNPFIVFWLVWYFLNLLPSSVFPLNDYMAEHRTYISNFGFAACVGSFLITVLSRYLRGRNAWAIGLLIFIYGFATVRRNDVWRTPIALWQDSVLKSPDKYRPHGNLGTAYMKNLDYDLAINEFQSALKINPNGADAYSGLGVCYLQKGNFELAKANFLKANYLGPDLTDPKTGLGLIYHHEQKFAEAIPFLEQAFPQRQESIPIVASLADCYLKLQNPDRAIPYLRKGIQLDPRNSSWSYNLMNAAHMLIIAGRAREAIPVLQDLRSDPNVGAAAEAELHQFQ